MKVTKIFFIFNAALIIFAGCEDVTRAQNKINPEAETPNQSNASKQTKPETDEEKAVRLAEEFIKRNGYTDAVADKDNLSFESMEISDNKEEILKQRKNSLEAKAFGISSFSKGDGKTWTVVFRYNETYLKNLSGDYSNHGRAVTMDENFENLRVQHQDFFLNKVQKKLQ